tara:strand:+ start:442 stop:1776 length:1335 start_codon:yes stop_codon:yes gene_type:complete
MGVKKKFTRKRVNDNATNIALNDIYNKMEKLRPLTKEEVLVMTEPPEEGQACLTENPDGSSSIAFYSGGQWNVDINSNYIPANKNNFRALLGSRGASKRIIARESLSYNKDGNIPIQNTIRDKVLFKVATDKLSIRKSDDSSDADIAGANAEFSGDTIKIGNSTSGITLKNNGGDFQIRNFDNDTDGNLQCASIKDINGNKQVELTATSGSIKNHIAITNAIASSGPSIGAVGTDTNIDLTLTSKGTGETTLKSITGDVVINAGGGDITFKKSATTLGSFDTSGNFTAVGTSASSNGTCLGKYQYETKTCGFASTNAANFLPLNGGTTEKSSVVGANEFIGMVAPYNGTVEKIMFRSEVAQNGTLQMDLHESADGTEVPALGAIGTKDTSINIADDTAQDISFASMTSGTNALVKGRIYAIKITAPSAPNDTNATVVFKWDVTT